MMMINMCDRAAAAGYPDEAAASDLFWFLRHTPDNVV